MEVVTSGVLPRFREECVMTALVRVDPYRETTALSSHRIRCPVGGAERHGEVRDRAGTETR